MAHSYQPIEIGRRPLMFDAMDQLGQSLDQVGQQFRQDRALDEERKRQSQQDFQVAFLQAKKLADAGDLEGARALLAPYEAQLTQAGGAAPAPAPAPAPGPAPGPAQAPGMTPSAKPPQGGSPLPDGMEFPGGAAPGADAHPEAELPEQPPAAPANPIMAARQAQQGQQQAANEARARTVLNFRAPGGQQVTLDPEAARAAQLEQKAARLDAAFAGIDNPDMKQIYQTIRPVLLSSNQDVDPTDVFKYIQSVAADRRATAAAAAKQAHDDAAATQREALTNKRLDQSDKNSARMANAILGAAAGRNNTAETNAATTVAGRFDSEFDRWQKQQNWRAVQTASRALHAAMENAVSGNPLAEKDAQIQLARVFRGTTPTEGEMHLLYGNLAGRLGDALPRFLENMSRGGLDPAQKAILAESIDVARQEQQDQINNIVESARQTFGPGSGHENMAGNVNAKVRGLFQGVGLKTGDVFASQGGEPVPTVTLGKGNPKVDPEAQHPAVGARAAQKAKRAAAVPAKPAAMSDDQAVAMAKARLAANPNDAVARRVLELHGIKAP